MNYELYEGIHGRKYYVPENPRRMKEVAMLIEDLARETKTAVDAWVTDTMWRKGEELFDEKIPGGKAVTVVHRRWR